MSTHSRRDFLRFGANSALGIGLRAALTGLPVSFLLHRRARADEGRHRIAILASSSEGEPLNVCGPGTFDPDFADYFSHPSSADIDLAEVVPRTVNSMDIGVESLSESAEITLGTERVQMARCFSALTPEMLQHMTWFNYRSGANIHPQFKDVLTAFGRVHGSDGRGSEQLPAAIAQEIAAHLGTTTADPLVLGEGSFVSNGASLANYSPTRLRKLAESVGMAMGGPDNFAVMYDSFIDEAYREVRDGGTAQQLRFFDQHAASRREAADFGSALGQLLEDIDDDSLRSQMRCAAVIAKLRLAPVIMVDMAFGGDNHQDAGLLSETNQTLEMIDALDAYWKAIQAMGIVDDVLFANLDVFGRDPESDGNGRSHYGDFVSGMMVGTHLQGGVVGGWEFDDKARATGVNARTGSADDVDIPADETLPAYYRTIMAAAGISEERQAVRLPTGTVVSSVIG